MAKKATERKPLSGNLRTHSCHATKHMQKLNMVTVTKEDGSKEKMTAREYRASKKSSKKAA